MACKLIDLSPEESAALNCGMTASKALRIIASIVSTEQREMTPREVVEAVEKFAAGVLREQMMQVKAQNAAEFLPTPSQFANNE